VNLLSVIEDLKSFSFFAPIIVIFVVCYVVEDQLICTRACVVDNKTLNSVD